MESFGGRDDINFAQNEWIEEKSIKIDALGVRRSEFVHRFTDMGGFYL